MDTETTNSGTAAPESVTPATTNAPATSPADAFADDAPDWIKQTGLTAAHKAATRPGQEPNKPTTITPPVGQQPAQPSTVTPPPVQQPSTVQPQFSPEQLAAAVAAGVGQALPKPPTPQKTDADWAKELGIFTATADTYKKIVGVDPSTPEQVAELNNTLQAIARQAVTVSSTINNRQLQELRDSMAPYIAFQREQAATQQRDQFFKESPDLTGYKALVENVFQTALAQGQKFPSVEAARKFVADKTRELLRASGITPVAPAALAAATTQRTTPSQTRPMTPTGVGGRTGAGASPAKPANMIESVWGPKA